jgi:exopolyphosphatase/pppGpp-phosphohydrolase
MAAAVARYHRGALPRAGQKALRNLAPEQRREVQRLSGILRLANAFDASRDGRIRRLEVHRQNGFFVIGAEGYSARDRLAETIAGGRHLLEVLLRRPLLVQTLKRPKSKKPRSPKTAERRHRGA